MNFNIDASLRNAVENFSWDVQETDNVLPIHESDLNILVTEISQKIFAASDLRPAMEATAKTPLSLADVCYLIVKDLDSKLASPEILNQIQQAARNEKIILNHALKELSERFVNVTQPDLKVLTLLFGIKRISQVASKTVILFKPQLDQVQELEATLAELVKRRSQYDISSIPESQKAFVLSIDAKIQETSELLEALKLSRLDTKAI